MRSVSVRQKLALLAPLLLDACAAAHPSAVTTPARPTLWAFTAPWDPRSEASARRHAAQLDGLVSGFIELDSATARPFVEFPDALSRSLSPRTRSLAIVTNAQGGRFHPESVRRLASDPAVLGRAASDVARLAATGGYGGLVLDLEALSAIDVPATAAVVRSFADSARARGLSPIAVAVPALDTAAFPARALLPAADLLVVMLYDEHWSTSPPGPIASPEWTRRALALRVAEAGGSHVVAALPLYGYRWPADHGAATPVTFDDARHDAASVGAELRRDPSSQTLHAAAPGRWDLWVTDAGLLAALVAEVHSLGVSRVALWRLGGEDPAVWGLF